MKRLTVTPLLIMLFLMLGSLDSFSQRGRGRFASNRVYNPKTVITLKGTIAEVIKTEKTRGRSTGGLHLLLTSAGVQYDVHLGPASYVEKKMSLAKGDSITVEGSLIKNEGARIIISKKVIRGETVLPLRKEDGTPLWAGYYGRKRPR